MSISKEQISDQLIQSWNEQIENFTSATTYKRISEFQIPILFR